MSNLRRYLQSIPLALLFTLTAAAVLTVCFSFFGGFLAAAGVVDRLQRLLLEALLLLPIPLLLLLTLLWDFDRMGKRVALTLRYLQALTAVPYLYLLIFCLLGSVAQWIFGVRQIFLIFSITLLTWVATLLAAALYAVPVKKREVTLPLPPNAADAGKPFCIAVMSDLHLGRFTSCRHLRRAVDRITESKPDLILLPGDLADQSFADLKNGEQVRRILSRLVAPCGVFACEGNHDRAAGHDGSFFAACGITVLRDEGARADGFYLFGRRDGAQRMQEEELAAYVAERNPDGLPLLVLEHRPESIPALAGIGAAAVFCGHTHGGQTFPGNVLFKLLSRYNLGGSMTDSAFSYTTVGCGRWGFPARLFVPDEVVIFRALSQGSNRNG